MMMMMSWKEKRKRLCHPEIGSGVVTGRYHCDDVVMYFLSGHVIDDHCPEHIVFRLIKSA